MVVSGEAGQQFFRPAWFTDLCFFLGQYLLLERTGPLGL